MGLRQGRCLLLFPSFRLVECTIAKETPLSNFGHCSVVKIFSNLMLHCAITYHSYVLQTPVPNTISIPSPLHAHPKVRRRAAEIPPRGIAVRVGTKQWIPRLCYCIKKLYRIKETRSLNRPLTAYELCERHKLRAPCL